MGSSDGPMDALLAELDASVPMTVAWAVRGAADRLRDGTLDGDALLAVLQKLAALAADPRARVRQAVAEALPHLPERMFQKLHPVFAADKSPYVRNAAEDAEKKVSALKREAAREEEHDQRVARWYRDLDAIGARAVAVRVATHETEYFVRRMHHEAANAFLAQRDAMAKLREAIDAREIDRGLLRACADTIAERSAFVEHVLDSGRTHAKAVEPSFAPVRLRDLVADEAALLGGRVADRGGRVVVDVAGVTDVEIDADARFLRQAIANLLKNAVEAYDAKAERFVVRVTTTDRATDVVLAIADEGCGMSAESLEGAFVPFGSVKPGGTGFGLFIARRVARSIHGGELAIESAVGEGTTVTMTLPKKQETPPAKKRRTRKRDG